MTPFIRNFRALKTMLTLLGCLLLVLPAQASVGDCLKAALHTANPQDLQRAAAFATTHAQCLGNLIPPTLVPYAALSGSLDAANQSGALGKVGLGFGNDYGQCVNQLDPSKVALRKLAPVLQPVCSTLNMNCSLFEGAAQDQINGQIAAEVPLLSLMPCACAAATSGLGVERIADLVNSSKKCGATVAELGQAMGDAAKGVYTLRGDVAGAAQSGAAEAEKLAMKVLGGLGDVGCKVLSYAGLCSGGESKAPPTGYQVAMAVCKGHGGLWMSNIKADQPLNMDLACNDGLRCQMKPGSAPQCVGGLSKVQAEQAEADKLKTDATTRAANAQWCPQRAAQVKSGYAAQCHDVACKFAVNLVANSYAAPCIKESDFLPQLAELAWPTSPGEKKFTNALENLIKESIQRDTNASPLERMHAFGCKTFLGNSKDVKCPTSTGFDTCKQLVDAAKLNVCYLADTGTRYPEADPVQNRAVQREPTGRLAPQGNTSEPPVQAVPPARYLRNLRVQKEQGRTAPANP